MNKRVLIAALCTLLLTSCAKSDKKTADSSEENSDLDFISVDKLSEDVIEALEKEPSNFILSDNINVELPDEYYECDFQQISGFDENYESIYSSLFDEDVYKNAEIAHETTNDGMTSYSFEDGGNYCCVGDNGFIAFYYSEVGDNAFSLGNRVEIYHIDRSNTNLEAIYNKDTQITIGEIVENAQTWLDENYNQYEPDYDISVKTVIARSSDDIDDGFFFQVYAEKKYNGIALNNLVPMLDLDTDMLKYQTNNVCLWMYMDGEVKCMTNGVGMITPTEKEELTEIVSLSSAIDSIEETFTDFNEPMTINDINLKYTLTPVGYNPHPDYKAGEKDSAYKSGNEIDGNLVWEFVIDVPDSELPSEEYYQYGNLQKFIYVDAQTGEIDFEFDIDNLLQ